MESLLCANHSGRLGGLRQTRLGPCPHKVKNLMKGSLQTNHYNTKCGHGGMFKAPCWKTGRENATRVVHIFVEEKQNLPGVWAEDIFHQAEVGYLPSVETWAKSRGRGHHRKPHAQPSSLASYSQRSYEVLTIIIFALCENGDTDRTGKLLNLTC